MKKCKCLIILLTLMIILCSCSHFEENADIYERIYNKYNHIDNYYCTLEMKVQSNKTVKTYTLEQYYQSPDKYMIKVLSPDEVKGITTVYENEEVTTMYPEIGGKFTLMDFTPVDKSYIFISNFFEAYYKSEHTSVVTVNQNDNKYTILETDIPGDNIYRFSQKIWIDNMTLLPLKMEIYDIKRKPVITITYDKIEFNTELTDEIFKVGG